VAGAAEAARLIWRRRLSKIPLGVVTHIGTAAESGMSVAHALSALAALGQSTRLAIFRLLMQREPGGLPAGTLAQAISCPPNTLSSHLAILARAGLVRGVRNERSIIYRADIEGIRALISFLVTDCCNGHPELCDLGSRAAALVQRKDGDDGKPRRSEIIQRAVLVHGQLGALDRRARHPSRVNEVRTPGLVKLTRLPSPTVRPCATASGDVPNCCIARHRH